MKNYYLICLLFISIQFSVAQTLFSENMGTPSSTTTIAGNTFQNNGLLTYLNGGQTNSADVRTTNASSGYSNASGGANIFFASTSGAYGFSIEGINAANYHSLTLQYGYKKESAATHASFSVDYWNGSSWVVLADSASDLFNESATATAKWYLAKTLTLPIAAQINGLKIRFVKTGTSAIRIDDVLLTANGTPLDIPSSSSDVVFNTTSSASDNSNINYSNYQAQTITSTVNSVGVMGIYLRDGGAGLHDADTVGTELSAISFNVTNGANVRSARLFVSNAPKGISVPVINGVISFTGLTDIIAADDSQLAINLRVTFNTTVTDNEQMQFTISSVTANYNGSQFALANGGGASSSIVGDVNRIEVVASKLDFTQQPPSSLQVGIVMTPNPVIAAIDELENRDLDFTNIVRLTTSGNFIIPQTATAVAGLATFTYYVMDFFPIGTNNTLTASANNLNTAISNSFEVMASPVVTITNIPTPTCTNNGCNLVANGDFENNSQVQGAYNIFETACGWYSAFGSPDYFHSVTSSPTYKIPCNIFGAQTSNGGLGSAYAGFMCYDQSTIAIKSEIMVSRLFSPLVAGQSYQLSFDVSLAEGASSFSKTVQAYLSPNLISIFSSSPITINNLQMLFSNSTTSTISNGWETLTFTFTSIAGGEEYIYLGALQNLLTQPNTVATDPSCAFYNTYSINGLAPNLQRAYYYIDNVRLVPVDTFITSNDSFAATPSSATTNSVIVNDTFGGNPITSIPPAINYTITLENPLPTFTSGGITLNSDGTFTVQPDTPFGTYTFNYAITTNCGVSNVSTVSIIYSDDYVKHPGKLEFQFCFNIGPAYSSSSANNNVYTSLFDLGTAGGVPANAINATINLITPPDAGFTINPDGTFIISPVVVIPGVVSVTYPFTYEICSGGFCSTEILGYATIENSVQALPDAVTFFIDGSGPESINIIDNDIKWDCFVPLPLQIADVVITQIPPTPVSTLDFFPIDLITGEISRNLDAPIGVYTIEYKICDVAFPDNCSITYVKIHQCDPMQPSNPDNPCYFGRMSNPLDKIDLDAFIITPNPSADQFEIIFKDELEQEVFIEVYDVLGKKIINTAIGKRVKNSFVNLDNYPKGVYFLRITMGNSIINKKIIKK